MKKQLSASLGMIEKKSWVKSFRLFMIPPATFRLIELEMLCEKANEKKWTRKGF